MHPPAGKEAANGGVNYFVTLDEKTQGSAIGLGYQVLNDAQHPDAKPGRPATALAAAQCSLTLVHKTFNLG